MSEEQVGPSAGVDTKQDSKRLQYSNCVYTSCYCEENVWKLCQQIKKDNGTTLKEYHVVFISNKKRQVPLWMQKSGKDPLSPVIWDYHVILIQKPEVGKSLVYDLDSLLAFPCLLEHYVHQALQNEQTMKKEYHRKFRVIEAQRFLDTFASDRSHMRLPNGQYQHPPPNYAPIRTSREVMNLNEFINMSQSYNPNSRGKVTDLKGLASTFRVTLV